MKYAPTFQDYQRLHANEFDENGRWTGVSEDNFNRMSDEDKWGTVGGVVQVRPDDERYAELKPVVGGEDGRNLYLTNRRVAEDDVYQDRQADLGNGIFAHSEDAQTPGLQARAHKMGLGDYIGMSLPLLFTGAGMLATAGETAGSSAAAIAGTNAAESGGTLALNAAGTSTIPYVPGAVEAAGGTAAGGAAAGGVTGGAGTTGSGIINGARQLGSSAMNWYNGLSPAGRLIVSQGLSGAARAALGGLQQRKALEAARETQERQHQYETEAEQRARADFERRHSVSAFGSAFKPRAGIIDSRRTGG